MATRVKSAMFDPHRTSATYTKNTDRHPLATSSQTRHMRKYSTIIQSLFTGLAPEVLRMRLRQAAGSSNESLQQFLHANKDSIISALSHLKGLITLIFPSTDEDLDINKWSLQLLCIVLRASQCLTPAELDDVTFLEKSFRRHFRMRPQSATTLFGSARPKPRREWISVCSAIQRLVENVDDASLIKSVRNFICKVEMESKTLHAEREMKKRVFQTLMELIASNPEAKSKPESHSGKVITKKIAEIEKLRQNYVDMSSLSSSANIARERISKLQRPRIVSSATSVSPYKCRLTRSSDSNIDTCKDSRKNKTQSPRTLHKIDSSVKRILPDVCVVGQKGNARRKSTAGSLDTEILQTVRPNTAPDLKRNAKLLRQIPGRRRPQSSRTVHRDEVEKSASANCDAFRGAKRRSKAEVSNGMSRKGQTTKIYPTVQKINNTGKPTMDHSNSGLFFRTGRPNTAPVHKQKAAHFLSEREKQRPQSSHTTYRGHTDKNDKCHDRVIHWIKRRVREEMNTEISNKGKKRKTNSHTCSKKMSDNDQLRKRVPDVNDESVDGGNVSKSEKRCIPDSSGVENSQHNNMHKKNRSTEDEVLNQDDTRKHTREHQTRMEYASKETHHRWILQKRRHDLNPTDTRKFAIKENMSHNGTVTKRTLGKTNVSNKGNLKKYRIKSAKSDTVESRVQNVPYNRLKQKSRSNLHDVPMKQTQSLHQLLPDHEHSRKPMRKIVVTTRRKPIIEHHIDSRKPERAVPKDVSKLSKPTNAPPLPAKNTVKCTQARKRYDTTKSAHKQVVDKMDGQQNVADGEMKRLAMEVLVHQNVHSVIHHDIFNKKDTVDQFFDYLYEKQILKQFLRSPNDQPLKNWRSISGKTEDFCFLHCLIFRHIEPEQDDAIIYVVEKVLTRLQCQHLRRPGSVVGGGSMFQGRKSLLQEALQFSRSNTLPLSPSKPFQSPRTRPDSPHTRTRSNTAISQSSNTKDETRVQNPMSRKTQSSNNCWKCKQKDIAMEISINWGNTCITKLLLKEGVHYKIEHLVPAVKVNSLDTLQDIVSFLRERQEWEPIDERAKDALYEARKLKLKSLMNFLEQEGVQDERQKVCVTCFF